MNRAILYFLLFAAKGTGDLITSITYLNSIIPAERVLRRCSSVADITVESPSKIVLEFKPLPRDFLSAAFIQKFRS